MRFKGRIELMFLISALLVEAIERGSVCPLIYVIASKGTLVPFLFLTSVQLYFHVSRFCGNFFFHFLGTKENIA